MEVLAVRTLCECSFLNFNVRMPCGVTISSTRRLGQSLSSRGSKWAIKNCEILKSPKR
jgi:hypothetical protein